MIWSVKIMEETHWSKPNKRVSQPQQSPSQTQDGGAQPTSCISHSHETTISSLHIPWQSPYHHIIANSGPGKTSSFKVGSPIPVLNSQCLQNLCYASYRCKQTITSLRIKGHGYPCHIANSVLGLHACPKYLKRLAGTTTVAKPYQMIGRRYCAGA